MLYWYPTFMISKCYVKFGLKKKVLAPVGFLKTHVSLRGTVLLHSKCLHRYYNIQRLFSVTRIQPGRGLD